MQPRIKKSELSAVAYTIPDQSTRSFRVIYKWRITRGKGGRLKREGAGLINFLPRKRRALIRERGKDTREKKDRRKNIFGVSPQTHSPFFTLFPDLSSFNCSPPWLTQKKRLFCSLSSLRNLSPNFPSFEDRYGYHKRILGEKERIPKESHGEIVHDQ